MVEVETKDIAPGVWYSIHTMARNATTDSRKRAFIAFMEDLKAQYRCMKCRKHMTDYINKNPIEDYWNLERGFFEWSRVFHNAVNTRLGKQLFGREEAWNLYEPEFQICTKGCDESSKSERDGGKYLGRDGRNITIKRIDPRSLSGRQVSRDYLVRPRTLHRY